MRRLAGRHVVLRVFIVWVVTAVTLYVLSAFVPEIDIPGWGAAFAIAAVIGLLNAVMWPLFVRFALPITVLTLGVAALLLNGVIVWTASNIVDGFGVGVIWGIFVAFVLTVANTVVTSLLGATTTSTTATSSGEPPRVKGLHPPTYLAWYSSRSTASRTRSWCAPCATATCRWLPAGCARDRTISSGGRRTGRRRRVLARPDCCTATATTGRRFAGGRRSITDRSSRTIPRMPPSWSAAIRTGADCCMKTALVGRTSSPATQNTAC